MPLSNGLTENPLVIINCAFPIVFNVKKQDADMIMGFQSEMKEQKTAAGGKKKQKGI